MKELLLVEVLLIIPPLIFLEVSSEHTTLNRRLGMVFPVPPGMDQSSDNGNMNINEEQLMFGRYLNRS